MGQDPATITPNTNTNTNTTRSSEPENGSLPVHAAIDLGTNSFHLVVARGLADGGFEVITTEKEMVRLGQGSGEMRLLTDAAMDRGVDALRRMAAVAATHEAEITAVGTSAIREANNQRVFIDRVRSETGIEIEVISGFEEARLIHLGVLQALPVYETPLLLVDIGGGSTEFLIGRGSTVLMARSLKLGAIRLTDGFFGDGKITNKAVRGCRAHVKNVLAAACRDFEPLTREVAIGSSGTITAMASMIAAQRGEECRDMNGVSFTADELGDAVERLIGSTSQDRRGIDGLDAKRADIIVGGSILLEGIFRVFDLDAITVSGYALREGVLFDRLAARGTSSFLSTVDRLTDLRRANVRRLARQLDPDAEHAETAARLALRLFDQTRELHGLDQQARELLEMAAIVHNVGLFISHSAHHKHTYYIVRHSEQLTGFTEHERELLALVARYHRKGIPSDKHETFAPLRKKDKRLVRILAGLLRVAIGLDRSHRGLVADVSVTGTDDGLVITPLAAIEPESESESIAGPDSTTDIELEIYSAQERSELLAVALDVDVEVAGTDNS